MSIRHVSELAELRQILASEQQQLVVLDFHATWCGPCLAIAPAYQSLASQYQGRAIFLKIDVDAAAEVAQAYSVSALPTFHGYMRGANVFSITGASEDELAREIERNAPSSAHVAFSGSGRTLGTDNGAAAAVVWDSPPNSNAVSASDARAAAAAAAAKRLQAASAAAAVASRDENRTSGTSSAAGPSTRNDSLTSAASAKAKAALLDAQSVGDENDDTHHQTDGVEAKTAVAGSSSAATSTANAVMLASLREMGFPEVRAAKALIITGNKSAEVAMDWCFEHSDDPDIDEPLRGVMIGGDSAPSTSHPTGTSGVEVPKSTLSAEERQRIADELLLKARAKRIAEEKAAEIEREKNRLRTGKEVLQAKLAHEEQQRKIMVAKRLKEKAELVAERQRIRDRIAADKEARRSKFNMGPSDETNPLAQAERAPQDTARTVSSHPTSDGKIQFRLPDGSRLESSFGSTDTIGHAAGFVARERPDLAVTGFKLSQQYPKREFTEADMLLSLADTQLLPRGALIVSRL